jgi:hypothetical protein
VRFISQTSNWADILEPHKRGEEQEKDAELSLVMDWLENGHAPTTEELASQAPGVKVLWANRRQLQLVQGILHYAWLEENGERKLFVVPRSMRFGEAAST